MWLSTDTHSNSNFTNMHTEFSILYFVKDLEKKFCVCTILVTKAKLIPDMTWKLFFRRK